MVISTRENIEFSPVLFFYILSLRKIITSMYVIISFITSLKGKQVSSTTSDFNILTPMLNQGHFSISMLYIFQLVLNITYYFVKLYILNWT